MEADWEIEVGNDAPVVQAHWPGLVDLRWNAPDGETEARERAQQLAEARTLPGLAAALVRLNGPASGVRTSKCDCWDVEDAASLDPDELDADHASALYSMACYIDVSPAEGELFPGSADAVQTPGQASLPAAFASAAAWCRRLVAALRAAPLRQCRADLVVRGQVAGGAAVTAYLTACGATRQQALGCLSQAVAGFADAAELCAHRPGTLQSYNKGTGE